MSSRFMTFRAGMRGVMDATITVTCGSDPVGYHSGVHGGAISEPLMVCRIKMFE